MALPGGYRRYNGNFFYIGSTGYFWSTTELSDTLIFSWIQFYYDSDFNGVICIKRNGYSVRCLKN
jgi:uncharacterized protein (TIGR02145 family)